MKIASILLLLLFASLAVVGGWFGLQNKAAAADAEAGLVVMQTKVDEATAARGELESQLAQLQTQLSAAKAESSLPKAPSVASAPAVDVNALQAKLKAQARDLATLRGQLAGADTGEGPSSPEAPSELSREERRANEIERMKQEQPEEYKEMVQRRVQIRQEMKQGIDDRLAFFREIDLSGLPADTVARHRELIGSLGKMSATFAAMAAEPEAQGDFGDIREQIGAINEVMKEQRGILMQDLAMDLGLEGVEAADLVDTIDYIREMTSPPRPSFGRGGPGGPGGRGPR